MDFNRFGGNPRGIARLEERFTRIISANMRHHIERRRVLDLAASNGRWSCAAAEAGASDVIAIEGRESRVQEAIAEAHHLGLSDRCKFSTGDMYDWLHANRNERFDTVLCLGVFYHVMDHYQLLKLIARLQPNCIIIDSGFVRTFQLMVHVQTENPSIHKNALPAFEGQISELVGIVSLGMMNQMAWNCGYVVEPIVWDPLEVKNRNSVKDYLAGKRFTLRLLRQNNLLGSDRQWQDRWREALRRLNPKFEQLLDPEKAHPVEDPRVQGKFSSTSVPGPQPHLPIAQPRQRRLVTQNKGNSYLCSFHIPKVGGTTFASHAQASLSTEAFFLHGPFSRVGRFMRNQPQLEELPAARRNAIELVHGHGADLALAEVMVGRLPEFMVIVRDPYARFVSGFHHYGKEKKKDGLSPLSEESYFKLRGSNFYAKTFARSFPALAPVRGDLNLQSLMPILRSIKYFILTEKLDQQLAEISRRYGLGGGKITPRRVNNAKTDLTIDRSEFNRRNDIDAAFYSALAEAAEQSGGAIENPWGYDPNPLRAHLEAVWSKQTAKARLSISYDQLVTGARKTLKLQAVHLKLTKGSTSHVSDKALLLERTSAALASWLPTLQQRELSVAEFWAGAMFMQEGELALAEEYLRKAIELNPSNSNALAHLAKLLNQRGRYSEAVNFVERAAAIAPERKLTRRLHEMLSRRG